MRSSQPVALRLQHQTYRMLLWAQAVCRSPIAEIILTFREQYPAILQLFHARQKASAGDHVQRACQDWIKTMYLEQSCASMTRELTPAVLMDLVALHDPPERKTMIVECFQQLVSCPNTEMSPGLLDTLAEGTQAFLRWAELQGPDSLPAGSEKVACELVLRLLTEEDRTGLWNPQDQMILNRHWVSRLKQSVPSEQQEALFSLVARRASTLWTCLCQEGQEQDVEHCIVIVQKLFPQVCERLGDSLPRLMTGWLQQQLVVDWQNEPLPALQLYSYLGVSARLALSCREGASEILHGLFQKEMSQDQMVTAWRALAPIARSWPTELVMEGLGSEQRREAHVKALVMSGHPQMAGRVLDQMETGKAFLAREVDELTGRETIATPIAWRWWAFLAAKGPARWPLGSEQERTQRLSSMLSRVVRAALARGTWTAEVEIVLTALLNQGADPWRQSETAIGSPFEQTYLARLEKSLLQRFPGLLTVIDRIEDLLGVCPRQESPYDYLPSRRLLESPQGRRSVSSPPTR